MSEFDRGMNTRSMVKILQYVDPLLGNDLETNFETTSAAKQQLIIKYTQPLLSNAFANKYVPTETIGVLCGIPCGRGVEYSHCSPESRRR
jgi:hypothetical protein